jgi:simple sugar transport system permease protein
MLLHSLDENGLALIHFILSVLRISLPLSLAALAGFWSERSGTPQVGLEGFLLIGALSGASLVYLTHSMSVGFLLTIFVGCVLGYFFFLLAVQLQINAILVGLIFNLLIAGAAPFVTKVIFGSTGSTPTLSPELHWIFTPYIWAAALFALSFFAFEKTGFGLLVKFAGLKPEVITAAGYSVSRVRWLSLILCGGIAASGGFLLSTYLASCYSPMMSAGRGFMALAALIFSRWNLARALLMSMAFGFFEASQIYLQSLNSPLPSQFYQALPYMITLAVLLFRPKGLSEMA